MCLRMSHVPSSVSGEAQGHRSHASGSFHTSILGKDSHSPLFPHPPTLLLHPRAPEINRFFHLRNGCLSPSKLPLFITSWIDFFFPLDSPSWHWNLPGLQEFKQKTQPNSQKYRRELCNLGTTEPQPRRWSDLILILKTSWSNIKAQKKRIKHWKASWLPEARKLREGRAPGRNPPLPVRPGHLSLLTYSSWILWVWGFGFSFPFYFLLFFPFRTTLWNKQQLWKVTGQISHLLCTWAIAFESFVHQIVESSWISANWQLNFTFPERSGYISAWIFFSNIGAGNERFAGQCPYDSRDKPHKWGKGFPIPSRFIPTTIPKIGIIIIITLNL